MPVVASTSRAGKIRSSRMPAKKSRRSSDDHVANSLRIAVGGRADAAALR